MTKLEEISALLVSEIQQFESAVKKLEEIQKLKIQLDLRELHNMMSEYQENLKKASGQQQRYLQRLDDSSEKVQRTSIRCIIAVCISIIINLVTIVVIVLIN